MSNLLNFNSHSLFKKPLSRPIFYYDDARNIKKYYQEFENDNIYNFQYESIANQDITIDLLHAGILIDREIHANNYKKAARNSPIINESLYTESEKNTLRNYGIYLDVSNNIEKDTFFLIQNHNVGESTYTDTSYPPTKNILEKIEDNKLFFKNNRLPSGLPQHRNTHTEPYRGFDISNTIYQSIFTVGDKIEMFHDTENYKQTTGFGRKK